MYDIIIYSILRAGSAKCHRNCRGSRRSDGVHCDLLLRVVLLGTVHRGDVVTAARGSAGGLFQRTRLLGQPSGRMSEWRLAWPGAPFRPNRFIQAGGAISIRQGDQAGKVISNSHTSSNICTTYPQDNVVPLDLLDAPFLNRSVAEVKAMVQPVLMPLKTKGGGQEYYISMGHGHVLEKKVRHMADATLLHQFVREGFVHGQGLRCIDRVCAILPR